MLPKIKSLITSFHISKKKVIWVTIFVVFFALFVKLFLPPLKFLQKNQITPSFLANLLVGRDIQLKKSEGRTNILLLGISGKGYDGGDLTDTMIFVSINFSQNDILMVSLPRDIWLESLKDKINSSYHYGEERKAGEGFLLTKSAVEEVVGLPVHYVLLIDFEGFRKLIDLIGGLEINVENAFIDNKYPLAGRENDLCGGDKEFKCRYETISFNKGLQHMSGDQALKFVRSRNAEGDEGTDFARGKRQQKVMLAFQNKLLSLENLSPNKLSQLYQIFGETIKTDLTLNEAAYLGKFGLTFKGTVRSVPLETKLDDNKGFLINPPIEKYQRWVLVPRTGDFAEIQSYISCYIKNPECTITPEKK